MRLGLPPIRIALSALLFATLSACSSVQGTLVAPELENPRLARETGTDLGIAFSPADEITLFSDASARPPSYGTDYTRIHQPSPVLWGNLGYAFDGPLSVSAGLLGADTVVDGIWGGAKLALLGRRGLLGETALQASCFGRVGATAGSEDGDRNGEFGAHGFPWESERNGSFAYGGASVGYAISETFVPFLSAAVGTAKTSARVTQTADAANTKPGGTYANEFSGNTLSFGGGLGIEGEKVRLTVVYQRQRFEVNTARVYDSHFGARLELSFGAAGDSTAGRSAEN